VPRRTLTTLTAALAVSLAATATASAQGPDQQEVGLLFTQTAPSGTLKPVEGGAADRRTLVLEGVSRQVVWFTDRPARKSGHLPLAGFVSQWPGYGFVEDPPNAALTVLDASAGQDTVVLTLGQPRYRAKRDRLRYPAQLEGEASGNLSHLEPSRDRRVPRRFADASLFIDDATAPVSGACVIQPFAECSYADLHGAGLHGARLSFANLSFANLSVADLSDADLSDADLFRADVHGADLSNADLHHADLHQADLTVAFLSGANLSFANLSFANLPGATLLRANLTNADLPTANLSAADLTTANLTRADLTRADLSAADLSRASLPFANLPGANLSDANLSGANLSRANLSGAKFCRTTMPDRSINNSGC
jgi:uncharacterized protein YjbI with pentapeptide repeats